MRMTFCKVTLFTLLVSAPFGRIAHAQVFVRPPQDQITTPSTLSLKSYRAKTTVKDLIAETHLELVFHNHLNSQIEGTFLFPLSPDASVTAYSMNIAGREMGGEVLDRDQARETYEAIVQSQRDPGLLEYLGYGLLKASLFPIPPCSDITVTLAYTETIRSHGGQLTSLFQPLKALSQSVDRGATFGIELDLESALPLKAIYSPTHSIDILREGERKARVSLEGSLEGTNDFDLYFARDAAKFSLSHLDHRRAGNDGFFSLTISPPWEAPSEDIEPKDIIFVVDTSGSMQGEKMEQTQEALRYCLRSLNPGDRFNLITFSTTSRSFAERFVGAEPQNVKSALEFVGALKAAGGTNIQDALGTALATPDQRSERLFQILFVTDGLPTVGETDPASLLRGLSSNKSGARIFAMGVGDDVNTFLLDKLAEDGRGTRDYVRKGEDLEVKISSLYEQIARPALVDVQIEIEGLETYDVLPKRCPDIFFGRDTMIVGRYRGYGERTVTLKGIKAGVPLSMSSVLSFANVQGDNAFLPSLFATRKVGYLLDQIRLNGSSKELVDEVIALGKNYGIVTPYTSSLIIEDGELAQMESTTRRRGGRLDVDQFLGLVREKRGASESFDELMALGEISGGKGKEATGRAAVLGSELAKSFSEAKRPQSQASLQGEFRSHGDDAPTQSVQRQARTRWIDGILYCFVSGAWVDSLITPDEREKSTKIEAFSVTYFELVRQNPGSRQVFALGPKITLRLSGLVYEISD